MKSSRPYLARALYEWLLDNELTPYLVVDATQPGAVRDLFMENQAIGFNARFGGQPMQVMIPTPALIAIYARENGAGMVFGHEPELDAAGFDEHDETSDDVEDAGPEASKPELTLTEPTSDTASNGSSEAGVSDDKPKKKPTLRVVK